MLGPDKPFETADKFAAWVMSSELGDFLRISDVRMLIGQESVIDHFRPFVETPDLMGHEEELILKWKSLRPNIHAIADELAHLQLLDFGVGENSNTLDADRYLLRMAAYRRLDAWHTGQDKLTDRSHALAGDLYIVVTFPEVERPVKIGPANFAFYENDPRKDEELVAFFKNEAFVREVEFTIFPLAGRSGLTSTSHWRHVRSAWRECSVLRALESSSRYGAFPSGIHFQDTPRELVPRVAKAFLDKIGPAALLELGLCAWWPTETEQFLAERSMLFPTNADENMLRSWCARGLYARYSARVKPVPATFS